MVTTSISLLGYYRTGVKTYSPNQPRDPAGTPISGSHGGGRWTSAGGAIWRQSRDDYVGKLSEKPTEDEYRVYRNREHDWDFAVRRAVSEGKLSPQDAAKLGLFTPQAPNQWGSQREEGSWQLLPKGDLYHVTTALPSVMQSGLKSRRELGVSTGVGLGGGDDQTISFTDDLNTAQAIYDGMKEARGVARDDITFKDLIDMADKGEGAKTPYLLNIIHTGGINVLNSLVDQDLNVWKPGDPLPIGFQEAIKGNEIVTRPFTEWKVGSRGYTLDQIPAGGTPVGTPINGIYPGYSRKATTERLQELRFDFYTRFSFHRQYAGGRIDPLFIFNDIPGLAATKESDIALLTFKAKPETYGYQVSGLSEWRTYSGNTVTLVSSKDLSGYIKKYSPTQPRVPSGQGEHGGEWTSSGKVTVDDFDDAGIGLSSPKVVDFWNASIKMTPGDFSEAMKRDLPYDTQLRVTGSGRGIGVSLTLKDGAKSVGTVLYSIKDDNGKLEAYADLVVLSDSLQGRGVLKPVIRNLFDTLERIRVDRISLEANLEVGGYAWARYGFVPKDWKGLKGRLENNIGKLSETNASDELFAANLFVKKNNPKALWAIADLPRVGKRLLLGSSWKGTLDMKDKMAMRRLRVYVGD